jgi:hypothetical protein
MILIEREVRGIDAATQEKGAAEKPPHSDTPPQRVLP